MFTLGKPTDKRRTGETLPRVDDMFFFDRTFNTSQLTALRWGSELYKSRKDEASSI